MALSRRRRQDGPTPLAEIAAQRGLVVATRHWLERTIADVAFDAFAFGDDVLYGTVRVPIFGDGESAVNAGLERGRGDDGVILAVGSVEWLDLPHVWIAAQSKRGRNLLELDEIDDASGPSVGHGRFDETFDLDADDDAMEIVRSVLTDELCDWAVHLDEAHGPLIVIFDGGEDATHDEPEHGSAVFVAREVEVDDDDAFVDTLAVTVELVTRFRSASET